MVFSSLFFLFRFLPLFFVCYMAAPRRARNLVLLLGSLIFYAWGEPVYVILMLVSAVSDYFHGLAIERSVKEEKQIRAKGFLISSLAINLLLLGFFKYADALILAVNAAFQTAVPLMELPLPVGISFYTFQTMSYVIDVYRKNVPAQRDFAAFCAFVTMFPQLVAGPIVAYRQVSGALLERRMTAEGLAAGLRRFLIGLGKKVLLANQAGGLFERIQGWGGEQLTTLAAWTGILCFACQIYFDFGGYSDMAVGLGRMLGFSFPENFNYPYTAKSVSDFWRRWHMTLSGWFREYVYIPLGGSRRGRAATVRNLLIVWALTGIWHGAAFHFLLWGLWFAWFLILEKLWLAKQLSRLPAALCRGYTMLAVLGGWVLFAMPDAESLMLWMRAMTGTGRAGLVGQRILYELGSNRIWLLMLAAGCTPFPARLGRRLAAGTKGTVLEVLFYLSVFCLSAAFLVNAGYNPFLYFRF